MFFLRSLLVGGLVVGAAACTDDGEKPWPKSTGSGSSSASTSSSGLSSSSSSGEGGTGGASTGGMGGASTGGMGGASTGGMGGASTGGMGGAEMGGAAGAPGVGGAAGSAGMGGMGGNGGGGGAGGSAPQDPLNLMAVVSGKYVKLDWTKSAKPTSLILRKLGSDPTDANDPGATIVYIGTGSAALEPLRNILPNTPTDPRTYHYAVFGCDGTCGGTPATATLTPTITQCLVGGGYNLFWRHASADVCSDNTSLGTAANTSYPDWWKRCDNFCPMGQTATATARQLNSTGMMEATAIGNSFAMRGVPFGRMLSSEYCRALTTAQLMNVVPNIEQKPEITYFVYNEANRCNDTMTLLAVEPPTDANTGMISHAGFVCPTLDTLAWAEAAIYKPDGMGGSTFIARVKWNEWDALP